jgi:hypothetical protein
MVADVVFIKCRFIVLTLVATHGHIPSIYIYNEYELYRLVVLNPGNHVSIPSFGTRHDTGAAGLEMAIESRYGDL